ncbi:amidohydrolase family protein [Lichenibacterium ramalinae]|uniref:Amidohydrolase n=1 Tax=Lichenibacterium ramalinae TaxID=2316527 RepID=A0A4Q2RE22_9HYPH|nr:amidohydrolase family protein [Lichenibacterium ramalinae]RYB04344.1 amidohydrolase [Lichenibacterium ramalinae]
MTAEPREDGLTALRRALPEGIVDAHHHLWDLDQGRYPWLQDAYDGEGFFLGPYAALRRDYAPGDLRNDTLPLRLAATVHIEAERDRADQLGETRWLETIHAASGLPTVLVGHASFLQADLDALLAAQAASPLMRGIRSKPVTADRAGATVEGRSCTLQDPAWLRGLSRLRAFGLSWDLRVPFWHLAEAAEVAASLPDQPIAVNHCGLPIDRSPEALAVWRRGLAALAASPRVVLKLSELGLRGGVWDGPGNAAVVRDAVAIFGVDRVLYGSNLPVSSLSAPIPAIVDAVLAGLPDHEPATLRAVFADNARRFYRI